MERILVIQTASLGDAILATSIVENLHSTFPAARVDILVKKGYESLFAGHPFLNRVLVWDKTTTKFKDFLRLTKEARNNKYDLVVNIQRFFLTGLLTVLSGSRETRGFSKNPLSLLFSKRFDHDIGDHTHETVRNHRLIGDLTGDPCCRPKIYPSKSDENAIAQYTGTVYYTISPASLWKTKQLPADKWIGLIRRMDPAAGIFLLGAGGESDLCGMIAERSDHRKAVSLAGRLTLLQSAALMSHARMNFTNDSAPMHLASAVNAPVTAVYCSTVPAFGFGPLSDISNIVEINNPLSCRPCGLHGYTECPEQHFRCAYGISTDQLAGNL
jgi:heptosyltransferase II